MATLPRVLLPFALLMDNTASAQIAHDPINPAPTAADWRTIARLPDWSGT